MKNMRSMIEMVVGNGRGRGIIGDTARYIFGAECGMPIECPTSCFLAPSRGIFVSVITVIIHLALGRIIYSWERIMTTCKMRLKKEDSQWGKKTLVLS